MTMKVLLSDASDEFQIKDVGWQGLVTLFWEITENVLADCG